MLRDLYYIREKLGFTQRQLAKSSGVSKTTITNIENGLNIPRIDTVCYLSNALKIESLELFTILCDKEPFSKIKL